MRPVRPNARIEPNHTGRNVRRTPCRAIVAIPIFAKQNSGTIGHRPVSAARAAGPFTAGLRCFIIECARVFASFAPSAEKSRFIPHPFNARADINARGRRCEQRGTGSKASRSPCPILNRLLIVKHGRSRMPRYSGNSRRIGSSPARWLQASCAGELYAAQCHLTHREQHGTLDPTFAGAFQVARASLTQLIRTGTIPRIVCVPDCPCV